jgi:hypothetical protein
VTRDERDDLAEAFGRQAALQVGAMPVSAAGLVAGALLGDGLGGELN